MIPITTPTPSGQAGELQGRVLCERPSKASLIRLAGDIDAWAHQLRTEAGPHDQEALAGLRVLTTVLAGAIDATPDPPDDTVADQVLAHLRVAGQARPSEIADRIGKSRSHISKVLSALKDDGLVEATPGRDGRTSVYRPADAHA